MLRCLHIKMKRGKNLEESYKFVLDSTDCTILRAQQCYQWGNNILLNKNFLSRITSFVTKAQDTG